MGRVERTRELARQRTRRAKLKKYRAKFAAAASEPEKEAIRVKVRVISPLVDLDADDGANERAAKALGRPVAK
jgi:hypothetical protein